MNAVKLEIWWSGVDSRFLPQKSHLNNLFQAMEEIETLEMHYPEVFFERLIEKVKYFESENPNCWRG